MGDLLDLAREAAALPGWRWMPGMRGRDVACRGFLLVALHHSGGAIVVPDGAITTLPVTAEFMARCLPDLADPATLGCLLALVREAWASRAPSVSVAPCMWDYRGGRRTVVGWTVLAEVGPGLRRDVGTATTEAHALVAALRAAGGA